MKTFFIILLFTFSVFSQQIENPEKFACSKEDKSKVIEYLEQLEKQNNFIRECEEQSRKESLEKTGNPPVKIAGGCEWTNKGCPRSLVLPEFPSLAKELRISGVVDIEIILDREGKVINAKALSGHKLLKIFAIRAACKSLFSPQIFCEKPVIQKKIIRYNFIL